MERWAVIVGYEGRYEVSDHGCVRSLPRKFCPTAKMLTLRVHRDGYRTVALYDGENRAKQHFVHRLVALAFLGKTPEGKPLVNHGDGNKANNHFKNLEWSSHSENTTHAYRVLNAPRAITRPWLGKSGDLNPRSKAVIRSGNGKPEKRYASVSLVEVDGFCFKHVSAVCRGKRQQHGGHQWRFEEPQ